MSALEVLANHKRSLGAGARIVDDASVREFLTPIAPHLRDDRVMELCINRPGEAHIELPDGWRVLPVPEMTRERCLYLARAIATLQPSSTPWKRQYCRAAVDGTATAGPPAMVTCCSGADRG